MRELAIFLPIILKDTTDAMFIDRGQVTNAAFFSV